MISNPRLVLPLGLVTCPQEAKYCRAAYCACLQTFLVHHQRLFCSTLGDFPGVPPDVVWRPSWYTTRDCLERLCYNFDSCNRFLRALLEDCNYFTALSILFCINYRTLAITSRKHVIKHFRMAKKYCAQWQMNGSWCLTHNLCAILTGSTQCDNCAIATVNII